MKTRQLTTDHRQRDEHQYALHRGPGLWEVTFKGQRAIFKHELGALYVACLLLEPPCEPIHAMALALEARDRSGQAAGPGQVVQQRSMGLEDAATVQALWRRQRALERDQNIQHPISSD